MDVAPHRSERGGTKGTFIAEEVWGLPKGEGSLGVQPLSSIQTEHTKSKERELFNLTLTDRTGKTKHFC
jgi:hypothetical protein